MAPKRVNCMHPARSAGIRTKKVERRLHVYSSHNDIGSLLDYSSNALYEAFSKGSNASFGECLGASAAYVFPLMDVVENFGDTVKPHVPEIAQMIIDQLRSISQFYGSVPFLSSTMSTLIYSGLVKKNQYDVSYFVRYHVLQSQILSSFQNTLAMFYFKLLPFDPSSQDFLPTVSLMSAIFASFGAVFYCIGSAVFGRYASLPIISEAVQLHIGEIPSNSKINKPEEEDTDDEQSG
ncbi:putative integral membrane protein [Babesia bovis T2Bo]|nr:putative integral membrane protein [Babesia bovis T2Bo]EDO08007.1 putative integral membrane protein [Babesia bovis T2Bo]|eukprot:XP_001611575.1 hypothetical protein [Babesia bovis T2Bo]